MECDAGFPHHALRGDEMTHSAPPEALLMDFVGMTALVASPAMRRVLTVAARIAPTSLPVLITGESGTGSEGGAPSTTFRRA